MKKVVFSLLIAISFPLLLALSGSWLSFGQPYFLFQAIGDLLLEMVIWPVQLFKNWLGEDRVISLAPFAAAYLFDIVFFGAMAYVALTKQCSAKVRMGLPAVGLLSCLCVPWFFSYRPSSQKLTDSFPKDTQITFANSKKLTIYSITTSYEEGEWNGERFHGYKVLGKTPLSDPLMRSLSKKFLYRAIDEGFAPAACFNPRHGIRATYQNKIVDLVICFECGTMLVYAEDEKGTATVQAGIAERYYNRILQTAGIPLSE